MEIEGRPGENTGRRQPSTNQGETNSADPLISGFRPPDTFLLRHLICAIVSWQPLQTHSTSTQGEGERRASCNF